MHKPKHTRKYAYACMDTYTISLHILPTEIKETLLTFSPCATAEFREATDLVEILC